MTPAQTDRAQDAQADGYAVRRRPSPVTAVVPVKDLDLAKSRLALPAHQRRQLALAFATDTLSALARCSDVAAIIVVTADLDVAALAATVGARVVPDETDSLDGAIGAAVAVAVAVAVAASAARDLPDVGVLITPSDLPCLRADDVTEVLRQASGHPGAFVPDRSGTGTTMVIYAPGQPVVTGYGGESAARHTGLGLYAVPAAPIRTRHDVDTLEDLLAAAALGLGEATAPLLGQGPALMGSQPDAGVKPDIDPDHTAYALERSS